jgi:hypothetical protein
VSSCGIRLSNSRLPKGPNWLSRRLCLFRRLPTNEAMSGLPQSPSRYRWLLRMPIKPGQPNHANHTVVQSWVLVPQTHEKIFSGLAMGKGSAVRSDQDKFNSKNSNPNNHGRNHALHEWVHGCMNALLSRGA